MKSILVTFFIFVATIVSTYSSAQSSKLHDNSNCSGENLCIDDWALTYDFPNDPRPWMKRAYIGRITDVREDFIELDNFAPARNPRIRKKSEVSKSIPSLNGLKANSQAITTRGERVYVGHIFSNGDVEAHPGNPNYRSIYRQEELFNACACIGDVCIGDKVISPTNKVFHIQEMYKNGIIRSLHTNGYIAWNVERVQNFGILNQCTDKNPCECRESR